MLDRPYRFSLCGTSMAFSERADGRWYCSGRPFAGTNCTRKRLSDMATGGVVNQWRVKKMGLGQGKASENG